MVNVWVLFYGVVSTATQTKLNINKKSYVSKRCPEKIPKFDDNQLNFLERYCIKQ